MDTFTDPVFPEYVGTYYYWFGTGIATPSLFSISAANILNGGSVQVGNNGWLSMVGQTINNRFGTLVAGDMTGNDPYDTTGVSLHGICRQRRRRRPIPIFRRSVQPVRPLWGVTNGTLGLRYGRFSGDAARHLHRAGRSRRCLQPADQRECRIRDLHLYQCGQQRFFSYQIVYCEHQLRGYQYLLPGGVFIR